MEYSVEVENLMKSYGKNTILEGVSFRVERGKIFGVLGPNGAGKTTLLYILSTLLEYDDGKVKVLGHDIPEESNRVRIRIGFVPESFVFYDKLTVYENLEIFYLLYGENEKERMSNFVDGMLKKFGMLNKRNEISGKLSRGMKQRLNVARSLVNDPELILLDEPFLSLDPYSVKRLRDILLKEKKRGKTIILTSHLIDEITKVCDEVMILKDGVVVDMGKVNDLVEKYGKDRFEDVFLELTGVGEE